MHAPGVEVRPLRQITGEAEFNEIFFTDVEVPVENVLGEVGDGWQVAMTTLLHERGTLGFALTAALEVGVGRLIELARERGRDAARTRPRSRGSGSSCRRCATRTTARSARIKTGIPGPEGSVIKLHWSEQNQRLTKLGARAARRRTGSSTTAGGTTSSSAAAATRSRPARRRSCATSSPSACSASRGRAKWISR